MSVLAHRLAPQFVRRCFENGRLTDRRAEAAPRPYNRDGGHFHGFCVPVSRQARATAFVFGAPKSYLRAARGAVPAVVLSTPPWQRKTLLARKSESLLSLYPGIPVILPAIVCICGYNYYALGGQWCRNPQARSDQKSARRSCVISRVDPTGVGTVGEQHCPNSP